jgi:nitrite reductase (NADH) large subunit
VTTSVVPLPSGSRYWQAAQFAGALLTALLIWALFAAPTQALRILWQMTIPLLPAVFLINPMLWRNVCPLATLNTATGTRIGRRDLDASPTRIVCIAGVALLFVMVPARRFMFNTNGPLLAITIVVVGVLALAAGLVFARRAGFCNTLCPVLPVEKLYGQSPLFEMPSQRCATCSTCTTVGCIDTASGKAALQTVGRRRRSDAWLMTGFGFFAATFPGFIVAYFTLTDGPLSAVASTYIHVAEFALISFAVVAAFTLITGLSARVVLPLIAGGSLFLYYWYSAPALAKAYGAPSVGPLVVRVAAAALVSVWLARVMLSERAASAA